MARQWKEKREKERLVKLKHKDNNKENLPRAGNPPLMVKRAAGQPDSRTEQGEGVCPIGQSDGVGRGKEGRRERGEKRKGKGEGGRGDSLRAG